MSDPIDFASVDLVLLLSNRSVQQLLDIVDAHPDWSVKKIVAHHPKNAQGANLFTYNQARVILKRLHLFTVTQRRLQRVYEKQITDPQKHSHVAQLVPELLSYIQYRRAYKQSLPDKGTTTTAATPSPVLLTVKQQETFNKFDRFFPLAKQFFFTFVASFLFFFGGSLVFDTIFKAQTIPAKIGMFFAFMSLACGMFFFLYSLKYYMSIAVVLSFSSGTEESHRPRKGVGGFLQSLFGISVEVTTEKEVQKPSARVGLSYNAVVETTLERQPFVSIQVGTYNEKRVIDRFLLAATSMEYENYEVIVADDSTDETVQLLQQWEKHPRVKISHRNTRSGYKGAALIGADLRGE